LLLRGHVALSISPRRLALKCDNCKAKISLGAGKESWQACWIVDAKALPQGNCCSLKCLQEWAKRKVDEVYGAVKDGNEVLTRP